MGGTPAEVKRTVTHWATVSAFPMVPSGQSAFCILALRWLLTVRIVESSREASERLVAFPSPDRRRDHDSHEKAETDPDQRQNQPRAQVREHHVDAKKGAKADHDRDGSDPSHGRRAIRFNVIPRIAHGSIQTHVPSPFVARRSYVKVIRTE